MQRVSLARFAVAGMGKKKGVPPLFIIGVCKVVGLYADEAVLDTYFFLAFARFPNVGFLLAFANNRTTFGWKYFGKCGIFAKYKECGFGIGVETDSRLPKPHAVVECITPSVAGRTLAAVLVAVVAH